MYSFDSYGWLSAVDIPGRQTDVEPPAHGARQVGQPYPNWTGHEWVLAIYSLPPAPAAAPDAENAWWMTKLAFRSRFTQTEKATIEYAAAQNTLQAAGLRASLADQRDARYIDLKRADTIAGVQALEAATLIGVGRAAIILTTPVPVADRFSE